MASKVLVEAAAVRDSISQRTFAPEYATVLSGVAGPDNDSFDFDCDDGGSGFGYYATNDSHYVGEGHLRQNLDQLSVWHVVTAGNDVTQIGITATLDGLTIRDGNANGTKTTNLIIHQVVA